MANPGDGTSVAVKILLDMNLSPAWAPVLNRAGFQCTHWRDIGDVAATDATIMLWARDNGYLVFTHDMDFGTLLATTRAAGPSVLQVRVANPTPEAIGHDVIRLLNLRHDLFVRGVLVTLDKAHARVRVLPLGESKESTDEPG
jgi:predicted nuclease of predicted toxin-antitoxin system